MTQDVPKVNVIFTPHFCVLTSLVKMGSKVPTKRELHSSDIAAKLQN